MAVYPRALSWGVLLFNITTDNLEDEHHAIGFNKPDHMNTTEQHPLTNGNRSDGGDLATNEFSEIDYPHWTSG